MPPAGSPVRGAVSTRPVVVVDVRSAERLPVRPPSSRAEVTQGVIGVAVVTGHVQSVVVVLRVDGHAVVLGPRPLASVHHVHLHAQATTCSKYIVTTNLSPYIHVISAYFPTLDNTAFRYVQTSTQLQFCRNYNHCVDISNTKSLGS